MRLIEHVTVTVKAPRQKAKTFLVPAAAHRKLENLLRRDFGLSNKSKRLPAAAVLPELADDNARPAVMLRASRTKAGLTQQELASKLRIRQHHLSEMEHGKRPIGKDMAKRLAAVFAADYRLFI